MEQMAKTSKTGVSPMHPLFIDFPSDPLCYQVEDEYMFGADLLVAPVLDADISIRQVYLPANSIWKDAWTNQVFEGGQWLSVETPLDRIPLFLKGDSSLPIREV
jgi:alpha-D-xyloside xylohydrolase